jgi:hypothetical protein
MKKSVKTGMLIAIFAMVIGLVFISIAVGQKVEPPGKGQPPKNEWVVLTYDFDTGEISYPTATKSGGGASFDFYPTPDRAMLIVDDLNLIKKFHGGNLTGRTLSAKISIEASPGATFNYYNNDETGALLDGWADSGGFVRLYFNKVNTEGCLVGWHPERPDCEAQYWWSNPLHIDLVDLAARGKKGIKLEVPLDPEFWSDRDGHMGTDIITKNFIYVDHSVAFAEAVANVKRIGLSFGGNGWWAFGCGVNAPGTATFKLSKFEIK